MGKRCESNKSTVPIITGDADVVTLEHSVAMFRLLGGGIMGDMGKPLSALAPRRLACHFTHRCYHPDRLLLGFIEPFLKGETPRSFFQ